MTTRKVTTCAALLLSILLANLLQHLLLALLPDLDHWGNAYQSTVVRMGIMVLVFTPVFAWLDSYVKRGTTKYISASKKVAGPRLLGVVLGVSLALLALFAAFLHLWYRINLFSPLF